MVSMYASGFNHSKKTSKWQIKESPYSKAATES